MTDKRLEELVGLHDDWLQLKQTVESDPDSPEIRMMLRNAMVDDLNIRGADPIAYEGVPTNDELPNLSTTTIRNFASDGYNPRKGDLVGHVDAHLSDVMGDIYSGALRQLALTLMKPYKGVSGEHDEIAEAHEEYNDVNNKYSKALAFIRKASDGDPSNGARAFATLKSEVEQKLTEDSKRNPFGQTMYNAIAGDAERILGTYHVIVNSAEVDVIEKLQGKEDAYIIGNLARASDREKETFYMTLGREAVTNELSEHVKAQEKEHAKMVRELEQKREGRAEAA